MGTHQRQSTVFGIIIAFGDLFLRFDEELVYGLALCIHQFLDPWFQIEELLGIIAVPNGSADDQRGTGVIDQYAIHLIHHGEMVLALYHFLRTVYHVIAEIIETEFVVGTVNNIGIVGIAPGIAVGFVFVDAIHPQAEELEQRSVPFTIPAGQVIVHRNDVNPFTRQGIEVGRECTHEGFTFTRCHLGDLAGMQYITTDQLHIIVHHVPGDGAAGGGPGVFINGFIALDGKVVFFNGQRLIEFGGGYFDGGIFCKTAAGFLYNGKCFGENFEQDDFQLFVLILFQFIDLLIEIVAAIDIVDR